MIQIHLSCQGRCILRDCIGCQLRLLGRAKTLRSGKRTNRCVSIRVAQIAKNLAAAIRAVASATLRSTNLCVLIATATKQCLEAFLILFLLWRRSRFWRRHIHCEIGLVNKMLLELPAVFDRHITPSYCPRLRSSNIAG
jgi:hypothetical protein